MGHVIIGYAIATTQMITLTAVGYTLAFDAVHTIVRWALSTAVAIHAAAVRVVVWQASITFLRFVEAFVADDFTVTGYTQWLPVFNCRARVAGVTTTEDRVVAQAHTITSVIALVTGVRTVFPIQTIGVAVVGEQVWTIDTPIATASDIGIIDALSIHFMETGIAINVALLTVACCVAMIRGHTLLAGGTAVIGIVGADTQISTVVIAWYASKGAGVVQADRNTILGSFFAYLTGFATALGITAIWQANTDFLNITISAYEIAFAINTHSGRVIRLRTDLAGYPTAVRVFIRDARGSYLMEPGVTFNIAQHVLTNGLSIVGFSTRGTQRTAGVYVIVRQACITATMEP